MAIPESQLETWAEPGALTTSASTYATIKSALEDGLSPYSGKDYRVFLQGSYGNHTNIWRESDVDVVIRLDSVFRKDISRLSPKEAEWYDSLRVEAAYGFKQFKSDVRAGLVRNFGGDVLGGTKAINIKASGNRRSADIIAALQFRRYLKFQTGTEEEYVKGICFLKEDGTEVINFPRQHSANVTAKNQATDQRFKAMARIFKNMRTKLVGEEVLADGVAPSYYIEGLLYNVPDENFMTDTLREAVPACLNWLNAADGQARDQFVCANRMYWLFRGPTDVTWTTQNFNLFLCAAIKMWNDWN
jgi:hypothetical protein